MKHIIVAILAVLALSACGNKQTSQVPPATEKETPETANEVQLTDAQLKNARIVTGTAQPRTMRKLLKVAGVLEVPPKNTISISVPLGGYLKQTSLVPGMRVKKGEILATMEDQQYIQLQQDYLTALSRLTFCEAEANRQMQLNETKAASDKVYQQARSEYEIQKVLVQSIGEKLLLIGINPKKLTVNNISRSIYLYAPIAGYVTKAHVSTGQYISPSDALFELINPQDMHVSLTVFENDATSLAIGQKMTCYTNARPDKKYGATVAFINPNIGEERSIEVHAEIEGYGTELLPGMYVNAEIELKTTAANALPDAAIVKWNGSNYIFCEAGAGKFTMLKVTTGITDDGYVEILSALPETKIVTQNAYALLMKMKNSGD